MHFSQLDECPIASRQTGVTALTEIQTPHGSIRVKDIDVGDVVLTDAGFKQVERIIRAPVRSPSMARPVRLRGAGQCDGIGLLVAPCQVVQVRDDRIGELFGLAVAGVEARFLIGWRGAAPADHLQSIYYQMEFDLPRIVWAQGGLFACGMAAEVSDTTCPLVVLSGSQARAWRTGEFATPDVAPVADKMGTLA